MRYFNLDEFECPCGCRLNGIQPALTIKLDKARHYAGIRFDVNSGFRCFCHNTAVAGAPQSAHMNGWAADIAAADSVSRFKVTSGLLQAGFRRIGIAKKFIHADVDPNKPGPVIWIY